MFGVHAQVSCVYIYIYIYMAEFIFNRQRNVMKHAPNTEGINNTLNPNSQDEGSEAPMLIRMGPVG